MDDITFGCNGRDSERWTVEADLCNDCYERHGDTGAEFDVYECLLFMRRSDTQVLVETTQTSVLHGYIVLQTCSAVV